MENKFEQFKPEVIEQMDLGGFFDDAEERNDPYSKKEQELLHNYIDQMISLKQDLGIKSFEELKKPDFTKGKDLKVLMEPMRKLNAVMVKIKDAMTEHKFYEKITEISGTTPEGKDVKFELREQLEYWKKFYEENKIDWIDLPNEISVSVQQYEEIQKAIFEFGFNKMAIIPDDLVGQPELTEDDGKKMLTKAAHYEELHKKLGKGKEVDCNPPYGFASIKDLRSGLRIVLFKENEDLVAVKFEGTELKSVNELRTNLFKEKNITGLTESEFLAIFADYVQRNKRLWPFWSSLTESEDCATGKVKDVGLDGSYYFHTIEANQNGTNNGCFIVKAIMINNN